MLQEKGSRNATKLIAFVYYETYYDVHDAIAREKEIKRWRREKKNDLVRKLNPKWEDLSKELFKDRR